MKENKRTISKVKSKLSHDETERIVYAKLKKNADQWFDKIGSGSARLVYNVDDKYVIKVSKNKKGLAQNQKECTIGKDGWYDEIIAPIIYCASDYSFLVMKRARKVRGKNEFRKLMGFGIDFLHHELSTTYARGSWDRHTYEPKDEPINDESWEKLNEILDYVGNYGVDDAYGDIPRLSSWGVIKTRGGKETCVLVDYGIDLQILKTYYKKSR